MPGTLGIVSSGRMRLPLDVSNFWYSAAGNGDNKTVTFSWTNSPTNSDITGHRVNIYNSSDTLIGFVDSSGPTATSASYTFANVSTTYRARLFTKSDSGYSPSGALTPASNRRLTVVTGAASYSYDNSYWSAATAFIPIYWTESTWPGKPYNDNTYRGDKAFDNNAGTVWKGQSWAWPGGNDWLGFKIGAGSSKIRITNLTSFSPDTNNYNGSTYLKPGTITVDQWNGSTFNWMGLAWDGFSYVFGGQLIYSSFEIAANTTGYYRFYYTNLGANATAYGSHSVNVSEVRASYETWVSNTASAAATANTITDG
jgi:hypothetical protein